MLARDPRRSTFATDYDGTLAPIVDDPRAATPLPEALRALGALTEHLGVVGVISGRPVDFLAASLPIEGLVLVGQYGLERRVEGRVEVDPAATAFVDAVARAADAATLAWPDLYVERKGRLAVTVHWRTSPDAGDAVAAWVDDTAVRLGLAVWPTRMARELRPPVALDKGTAFETLADKADSAAFAGDDHGDLAAFDALDRLVGRGRLSAARRVAVRSAEAPPALLERADLVVDGPRGLAAVLAELVQALTSA